MCTGCCRTSSRRARRAPHAAPLCSASCPSPTRAPCRSCWRPSTGGLPAPLCSHASADASGGLASTTTTARVRPRSTLRCCHAVRGAQSRSRCQDGHVGSERLHKHPSTQPPVTEVTRAKAHFICMRDRHCRRVVDGTSASARHCLADHAGLMLLTVPVQGCQQCSGE